MDASTLIGPGVGLVLAVVVIGVRWYFTRSKSGFANVVKAVMAAVDKIDATDDVKHSLGKDLLDLFQQYLAPEDQAASIKAHVDAALAEALKKLSTPANGSTSAPVATPAL